MPENRARTHERQDDFSLDGLSFLLADVQDNLGAFLTAFLASGGWSSSNIGLAVASGGAGAVLSRLVGGFVLDVFSARRLLLGGCCVVTLLAVMTIAWVPVFWPIVLAHFVAGGAGALFSPIIAAISHHTAGADGYVARMGRNESFNHLGNASVGCSMSVLGKSLGPLAPLWGIGGLAGISMLLVFLLTPKADEPEQEGKSSAPQEKMGKTILRLLADQRLIVFFLCYLLFNLSNGATVPLMIERHAFFHFGDPSSLTALCIVVAQVTMAPVAYVVGRYAGQWPRKPLFFLALGVQPLRDALIVISADWPVLVMAQILDGLSSGIILVLFYAILADLAANSGRRNLLIGLGLGLGTIGALLSNVVSGMLTSSYGFNTAFVALAVTGIAVALLFLFAMPETHRSQAA
ncbi:MFS transporter [Gluconobacter morbifer]|uniref:Transmembrane transport protein n=1 Tax=Gluconobacter morbifer G707 TaxID=1088869 RepID=G6XHM6_9PROT|nr:MFS transporter [Gluconobacter morbifer]EHH69684.1 transmembrane transport protein [Gluconobacter morbifer G707]